MARWRNGGGGGGVAEEEDECDGGTSESSCSTPSTPGGHPALGAPRGGGGRGGGRGGGLHSLHGHRIYGSVELPGQSGGSDSSTNIAINMLSMMNLGS
jgi:hypothetical protein